MAGINTPPLELDLLKELKAKDAVTNQGKDHILIEENIPAIQSLSDQTHLLSNPSITKMDLNGSQPKFSGNLRKWKQKAIVGPSQPTAQPKNLIIFGPKRNATFIGNSSTLKKQKLSEDPPMAIPLPLIESA